MMDRENGAKPHDKAWERLSDRLRARRLRVGQWVRANSIFPHYTRREMTNVHLYFLKLFGCMICEAKSNRYDVPLSHRSHGPSYRDARTPKSIFNSVSAMAR
jgi:hypothetical protein